MAKQVKIRRGTATAHSTFTGVEGEITVDTTNNRLRIHDGSTAGGHAQAKQASLDAHTSNTDNPHGVTKAQVGLGDVDNVAAADLRDRTTHTGTQTADTITETASAKLMTAAERTKLDGLPGDATANATDAELRDRATHTGTQAASTITETAAIKLMTADERTKLDGIATGATANSGDTYLRTRTNHLGTQAVSTIANLQESLDSKATAEQGERADSAMQDDDISTATQEAIDELAAAELTARSGAAVDVFETTGSSVIVAESGPSNGITVLWNAALTIRLPSGIATLNSLSSTEIAPGEALVIDLTGTSPFTATVETANTALYTASLEGTKCILLQQSTNRFTGLLSEAVARALDRAAFDQVDNTSDADKPISTATQSALDGRSWDFLDSISNPSITTAVKVGNGLNVGWSALRFRTPLGEVQVAARAAAELAVNKALYIDPANVVSGVATVVETDVSAILSGLDASGDRIILLQTGTGRQGGRLGAAVTRKIAQDELAASDAASLLTTMQPEGMAANEQWLATASWNRNLAFKEINVGTGWYQYQPEGKEGFIALTRTDTKLDLEYLPSGASVTVWAKGASPKVYLHAAPLGETNNRAQMSDGDVMKVTQLGDRTTPVFLVENLNGTPVWDAFTRSAMTQSIALAGQSNWAIAAYAGGIGGFAARLYQRHVNSEGVAANYPSTYFIEGATGGTSITGASGWWNGGVPGAALTTYLNALDAAVAAGQPPALTTLWRQGEQDIAALDDGTLTTDSYKALVEDVFEYIRAYDSGTYATMQFVVSGPQAQDDETEFGGAMAARTAYIELEDDLAYVHADTGWYDVPRQYGNVHPFNAGYWAMGYRTATAYLRTLGGADVNRDVGPYINAVTLASDGLSVNLDIRCETDTIVIPNGRRGVGADLGPYPFEFCAVNGDPRTATPISLTGGTITRVSDTQVTLTLSADVDLTGARVYTYNGKSANARRGQFLRNDNVHGPSLGFPIRDQRTDVLA